MGPVQGCAAQPYPQCCSDHCDTLECFAGDINATLTMGFDSYKLDGCGAQRDIEYGNFDFVLVHFSRISQLHPNPHAPCAALGAHADRVLIGAWNPVL